MWCCLTDITDDQRSSITDRAELPACFLATLPWLISIGPTLTFDRLSTNTMPNSSRSISEQNDRSCTLASSGARATRYRSILSSWLPIVYVMCDFGSIDRRALRKHRPSLISS